MYITKERKKEILEQYKNKSDLFNWCEEYQKFISDSVHQCVTTEWEYIIKKSYEDSDAPFSYEDLDLFDSDSAKEEILQVYNNINDEEKKEFLDELNLIRIGGGYFEFDPDKINNFEEELNGLDDDDEIRTILEEHPDINGDSYAHQIEVYEWWIISDPLYYWLTKQGEIIINGAWGRCTTGQSISLDYCCMKAFISMLEEA